VDNPWRGLKKGHDYLNSIYTIIAIYIAPHFSENFENFFERELKRENANANYLSIEKFKCYVCSR
jgi:hypothetical protein